VARPARERAAKPRSDDASDVTNLLRDGPLPSPSAFKKYALHSNRKLNSLPMTYKSSFQDRAGQAAEARAKALEQYRARPQVDPKLAAERIAAGQERAEAKAEKAASK
jgi:hypothetical protein